MKKGFTLIELLAVIVVLAIIALIAVPVVLNIINDAKESSLLRSAEFYLSAVDYTIANAFLYHGGLEDKEYPITPEGDICKKELPCDDANTLRVEVNGDKPTGGSITINGGNISDVELYLSNKVIVKNEDNEIVYLNPKSFSEDSWETIIANVKIGNTDAYNVGDTREIELSGFENGETDSNGVQIKTYTIRIANKTNTGDVCTKEYFEKADGTKETYSKTACGFVIEFEDIILECGADVKMNLTNTNAGGWAASEMRTYVNDTIYNALPKELKDVIIDTTVVSGYGSGDAPNKVTTDKLYLLATAEVYENGIQNDTARENTRQLDYYKNYENGDGSIGVTTNNYSGAVKKYNGSAVNWWLRSARENYSDDFYLVVASGVWDDDIARSNYGVAVAFRL